MVDSSSPGPLSLTSSLLASVPSDLAPSRSRASSFSSMSTLTSLEDSDLEDSDIDEEDEATSAKKQRVAGIKKGAAAKAKKASAARRVKKVKDEIGVDGKAYLTAGLYYDAEASASSFDTKRAKLAGPSKRKAKTPLAEISNAASPSGDIAKWNTFSPGGLFPTVLHFGESLLIQERSFKLPFDVLRDFVWEAKGAAGGGAGAVDGGEEVVMDEKEIARRENSRKPPPYRFISKNVYVERKADKSEVPAVCQCKPPPEGMPGCGENCINRMMQYSCSVKTCPLGDACTNIPLGQQQGIPEGKDGLRVIWTGNRGFGLKTMVPISKGQYVMEYRGEIISRNESYRRVLTTYKDMRSFYFLNYDGEEVIDAGQRGNSSRFINHSCGPNCEVIRWKLSDYEEYQMGIFALQDIPAGTELSYSYGWKNFSDLMDATPLPLSLDVEVSTGTSAAVPPVTAAATATAETVQHQRCFCGADACSGFLGAKKQKVEKVTGKPVKKVKGRKGKGKGKVKKRGSVVVKGLVSEVSVGGEPESVVKAIAGWASPPKTKKAAGAFKSPVKALGRKASVKVVGKKAAVTKLVVQMAERNAREEVVPVQANAKGRQAPRERV